MKKISITIFPPSIPISLLSVSVEQKSFYSQHFQFQFSREVQKNEFCLRKSSKFRTATRSHGELEKTGAKRLEHDGYLGKKLFLSMAYFNITWTLIISQRLALCLKPILLHSTYSENSLKYRTGNENLNWFYKVICNVCTVSRKSAAKTVL